MIHEINIDV